MASNPNPGVAEVGWGGGEAEAARRLRLTGYLWRREPRPPSRRRRAAALLAAAVGYLVFSGLLVAVALLLWPPRPACLILAGAGYESNLAVPPNVFGKATLGALARLTRRPAAGYLWRSRRLRVADGPRVVRSAHDFQAWGRKVEGRSERTVVFYLAAHGAVDSSGRPCLLGDDADAAHGLIPVVELLQHLRTKAFGGKRKVLILDATQVEADWHLGMLSNGFARALEGLDEEIRKDPNLVVISASGPGQRSWPAPGLGMTAFGRFVVDGLSGDAAEPSGRLDAADLADFLTREVGRWARDHRDAVQTPVLLPAGRAGRERAAATEIASGVDLKAEEVAPVNPPPPSPEIKAAWGAYQRLLRDDPHPSAYAPHLWTLYQATVLRCDELERSGDPDSARALLDRLTGLRRQLESARVIPLGPSAGATLGMDAVEGRWPLVAERSPGDVAEALWSPPEGTDRAGTWQRVRRGLSEPVLRGLRLQLYNQALGRVSDDPGRSLGDAVDLIRALDDPGRPRPAEVHDLLMYRLFRVDSPPDRPIAFDESVRRAVEVRRRAEEAALGIRRGGRYPYSEQVEPWVRSRVEAGDRLRRLGQDLLFASDPAGWAEALSRLDAARKSYAEAVEAAGVVRDAIATRDEVVPLLPYYSRWLARRPDADDPALAEAETLWGDLHALIESLGSPGPDAAVGGLRDLTARVRKGVESARGRFRKAIEDARGLDGPAAWLAADALLAVPFYDRVPEALAATQEQGASPERLAVIQLWRTADVASRTGSGRGVASSGTAAPAPPPTDPDVKAARDGRMALAVLGRRLFVELDPNPAGADAEYARAAEAVGAGKSAPGKGNLQDVGRAVGQRFGDLVDGQVSHLRPWTPEGPRRVDVVSLLAPGRRVPAETPADVLARLVLADRVLRKLDGAGAARLLRRITGPPTPGAPAVTPEHLRALRKVRVRDLLVRQAARVEDDHWADADARAGEPYYRTAGLAYLADAEAVTEPLVLPLGAGLADRRASLRSDDALKLEGPATRVVTSERRVDVGYRIVSTARRGPRPGVPVLWAAPVERLGLVNPAPGVRVAIRRDAGGGPGAEADLLCGLEDPSGNEGDPAASPPRATPELKVHGLFRGQRFDFDTRIEQLRAADVVAARRPRPEAGWVSVRTEEPVRTRFGLAQGAIAFVLDASGSMGPPEGQPADDSTKFAVATRALERVLRELPDGLIVSVYSFGAARPNHPVIPPEQTIDTVFGPARWGHDRVGEVIGKLRAAEPWYESPIVRTILRARNDLAALGDVGFKSIVVLTDGDDNRFDRDALLNPTAKPIPAFLADAFRDGTVQLNVVGFRAPDPATEAKLREQFKAIATLPLPGRFYYVDDLSRLDVDLRVVMKQDLRYRLSREGLEARRPVADHDVPVGRMEVDSGWFPDPLPPGGYRVGLSADPRVNRSVELGGGDQLLLALTEQGGGLGFERLLCPADRFAGLPPVSGTSGPWRLTAYSGGISPAPERALRLYATLELDPVADRQPTLRLPRPRELLFEVSPEPSGDGSASAPAPARYRWADRDGVPAPAWSVVAPAWPAFDPGDQPLRPVVQVWWRDETEAPASAVLRRDADFVVNAPGDLDRPVKANGVDVTVASVRTEAHRIETADGVFDRKECLVVRLTHPRGRRVWARPRDVEVAGHEHRFYASDGLGHYTGVFWTKTADEALATVRRIDLIEAQAFKQECAAAGSTVRLTLDTPQTDVAPVPPAVGPGTKP